jgi:transcriptional regulator with XRE-family HTH domain
MVKQIKIAMAHEGYNITRLAEGMKVSHAYMSNVLRGKASPEKMDEVLAFLGYTLEVTLEAKKP